MTTVDIHYSSARDLEEVMLSYLNSKQLLKLLQSKGIFVFNAKKSELAKLAASYLYCSDELTAIRRKAYSSSSKSILSGFHLTSKKPFDMNAIYNELRDGFSVNAASDYSLKAIHKETGSKDGKPIYRGELHYRSKKMGRLAFIQVEERDVDFRMISVDENNWLVEVDGTKSIDGKEVQKILKKAVKQHDISVENMELEALSGKKPIDFFDQLAQKGMSKDWTIDDIKRITIRKPASENTEDGEEVEDKHLSGIKQAILDGVNLRENPFVKSSEGSFIFTSMTYVFLEKNTGNKLVIRAEFKGNPKIFEVVLEQFLSSGQEVGEEGDGEFEDIYSSLSSKDNWAYRSMFWKNAKEIYDSLLNN